MFVVLHCSCTESLASEEASRLAAMQQAERNIEERLNELHAHYHQQRQSAITTELLDIIAGYAAVTAQ
jgi:F-type H+-transporting ATPase subunit gamma